MKAKRTLQKIYALISIGCGIGCGVYGYYEYRISAFVSAGNDGASLGFGIISAAALVMVAQLEISKGKQE